jgi:hypothetical protein
VKSVTATEARKDWFRLLDDVAAGEVVVIERGGRLLELRRREAAPELREAPDYSDVLRVPDADAADAWGWQWEGPGQPLRPTLKPHPRRE